ncbi:MAG: SIS domain-containing protein [Proteobacteria bacterium]|nr:SIS domain-containing protein [Pseudomonadota bacterium]
MMEHIVNSLKQAHQALEKLLSSQDTLARINEAARVIIDTFEKGNRVFSCGNGGSMCDAMHFAEELTGRYRKNRRGFPAMAISDPGHLTCVANDFGYEQVFSRYIESHGRPGDCIVAMSTSGKSSNVIRAVETAKSFGMHTIALTGRKDSEIEKISEICINTPGGQFADRVQEVHIKVLHILIELVERHFHPENYNHED